MRVGAISGVEGVSGVSSVETINADEQKTPRNKAIATNSGQISLVIQSFLMISAGQTFFGQMEKRFRQFSSNDFIDREQQKKCKHGDVDILDWRADCESEKKLFLVVWAYLESLLNALHAIDGSQSNAEMESDPSKIDAYIRIEGLINHIILLRNKGAYATAPWMLDLESKFNDLTDELGVSGIISLDTLLKMYANRISCTTLQGSILDLKA